MMEKEERIKKITEVAQKYEQVWKTCDLGGEDSIASIGTFIGSLIENADKRYGKDIAAFVAEILCDYANGQTDNFELTCKRKDESNTNVLPEIETT